MIDKIFEKTKDRIHSWIETNYSLQHGFNDKRTISSSDVSNLYSSYLLEKIVLNYKKCGIRMKENINSLQYEKLFGRAPYDAYIFIKEGKMTIEQFWFSLHDLKSEYFKCFSVEKDYLIITPIKGTIKSIDELMERGESYVIKEVVTDGLEGLQKTIDKINRKISLFNKELEEFAYSLINGIGNYSPK